MVNVHHEPGYYEVIHEEADIHGMLHIVTNVVKASSRQAALDKYNELARERSELPHLWNQVGIENVATLGVIE